MLHPTDGFSPVLVGFAFLESPRWHDGRIWVSDIYGGEVVAVDPDTRRANTFAMDVAPSGLGWMPDGTLLVVSGAYATVLAIDTEGTTTTHARLALLGPFPNDLVHDAHGSAYVGSLGFDLFAGETVAPSNLVLVGPAGHVRAVADGLRCPNGMAISRDGRTLLVAESFGNVITAFDIESDGSLAGRRDWVRFGETPRAASSRAAVRELAVLPDGLCRDNADNIWVADVKGRRILGFSAAGRLVREVSTGEHTPYACVLGGPYGDRLFVCLASTAHPQRAKERRSSVLAEYGGPLW